VDTVCKDNDFLLSAVYYCCRDFTSVRHKSEIPLSGKALAADEIMPLRFIVFRGERAAAVTERW
jgi:hypothetical protein